MKPVSLPCDDLKLCLEQLRKALSLPVNDPRNWRVPCTDCMVGIARKTMVTPIEPDEEVEPYRRSASPCESCGVTVKTPGRKTPILCRPCYFAIRTVKANELRNLNRCIACGGLRNRYAKYCCPCYRKLRKQPNKCKSMNCVNKSRRGGYCIRHAKEKLVDSQTEYRIKTDRIIKYQEGQ